MINLILLDKVFRKYIPFTNITSAVKVKNLCSSYKSLGIWVKYVSEVSGLCLTVFPRTPYKSGSKMVCVLVISSNFIRKLFKSFDLTMCLKMSLVGGCTIACLLHLLLGVKLEIHLYHLYHFYGWFIFLHDNVWHVIAQPSVCLENCRGSIWIVYYPLPLSDICNKITLLF